jgi:hypothetical protein
MSYNISNGEEYAQCLNCGKISNSIKEINKNFGWKTNKNNDTVPCSYCKKCISSNKKLYK